VLALAHPSASALRERTAQQRSVGEPGCRRAGGCQDRGAACRRVDRDACFPAAAFAALRGEELLGLLVPLPSAARVRRFRTSLPSATRWRSPAAPTAMIFAMHQIQVACMAAHCRDSDWHLALLSEGVPGAASARLRDLGSLVPAATFTPASVPSSPRRASPKAAGFGLEKKATTISYVPYPMRLLITARRPEMRHRPIRSCWCAAGQLRAGEKFGRDSLGMRGTCSDGFRISVTRMPKSRSCDAVCGHCQPEPCCRCRPCCGAAFGSASAADAMIYGRRDYLRRRRAVRAALLAGAHRLAKAVAALQLMQSRLSAAAAGLWARSSRPCRSGFTAI